MSGKMSVGVRTAAIPPNSVMRIASTTKVYGLLSASLTSWSMRLVPLSTDPARLMLQRGDRPK